MRVLFPLPDTPVIQTILPRGRWTSMFFRLFSAAPRITSSFSRPIRRFLGRGISFAPLRYCPVIDWGQLTISSSTPVATISPPCSPAPGPISMIWSAARIIASSCSTINTVLPRSLSLFSVSISRLPSAGCRPTVGSSQIYSTPTRPLPI